MSEKIMVVGGYSLDLYCRDCKADKSIGGSTKRSAYAMAKRYRWKVRGRVAICPNCQESERPTKTEE